MEDLAEQGRRLLEEYVSERDVDKAGAKLWNDGSRQVVRAFLEATAQMEKRLAPQPEPERDINRCAVCGWPLVDRAKDGCVRGNCSMRPLPRPFYDSVRANTEYGGLLVDPPALPQPPKELVK